MDLSVVDLSPVPAGGNRHRRVREHGRDHTASRATGLRARLGGRTPRPGESDRRDDAGGPAGPPRRRDRRDSAGVRGRVAQPLQPVQGRRAVRCVGRARTGTHRRRTRPGQRVAGRRPGAGHRAPRPEPRRRPHREDRVCGRPPLRRVPGRPPLRRPGDPRSDEGPATPWVLGSSPSSASIAAELGLPYCFAAFIRPQLATQSFAAYREQFEPSASAGGVDEPRGMVAVNAVCAETDEEAARLRAVAEAIFRRMQRGAVGSTPSVGEAIDELGGVPEPTPATLDAGDARRRRVAPRYLREPGDARRPPRPARRPYRRRGSHDPARRPRPRHGASVTRAARRRCRALPAVRTGSGAATASIRPRPSRSLSTTGH